MEKTYKRKTREVNANVRTKISSSLKRYNSAHPRSKEQNQKIAQRT